jgi:transcriptional regulator with XRE-family HTH domain
MNQDVTNFPHHFNSILKLTKLTLADICRDTSIPMTTLYNIASGKSPDPKLSTLSALANRFGLTLDQLTGKMPLPERYANQSGIVINPYQTLLPLVPFNSVLTWEGKKDNIPDDVEVDWVIVDIPVSEMAFCMKIENDKSFPVLPQGTLLIVDPKVPPDDKSYVVVCFKKINQIGIRKIAKDADITYLNPLIDTAKNHVFEPEAHYIKGTVLQAKTEFLGKR